MPMRVFDGSRIRRTIFSPNSVGSVFMRRSMGSRLRQRHLDPSILGDAAFGNIERGHDLEPRGEAICEAGWGCRHLPQDAVGPKSHAVTRLVGFEVNVRSAGPDGFEQGPVHEPDDGRVVRLFGFLRRRRIRFDRFQVDLAGEFVVAIVQHRDVGALPIEVPLDGITEPVGDRDHGFHVDSGREPDRVERHHVGGIRQGDPQRVAASNPAAGAGGAE